jgi:penicillin-insensitive murein endopeptidase
MKTLLIAFTFIPYLSFAVESTCYGSTSNGRLENGVQLPASGKNYVGYSTSARLAGRTYVHSQVKSIIVAAYKDLETEQADKVYKYAETGFKKGGKFKPHKTHWNGLSVDFMTPVIDSKGRSVHLPTTPFNRLGYDIEFNEDDEFDGLHIDYEALAAHIVALHKQALAHGHDLWRVIFDPNLQPKLLETQYGDYLKTHIEFSKKRSWVRHDEHYHIDFDIPCQ